jgi:hypothetical protein
MRGGRREGAGRPAGRKNRRTREVEEAMQVVAEKVLEEVPDAFAGDGVALMQVIYRDPSQPIELRLSAANMAARFERPTLGALAVKADLSHSSPADIDARIAELLAKGRQVAQLLPPIEEVLLGERRQ